MVPVNKLLAVQYTLEGPGANPTSGVQATAMLEKYISQLIGIFTIVAVIYFVIQIIFAGYAYLSANGDAGKVEKANKYLTGNLLGLIIVIVAVGIGSLIAKLLGINNPLDIQSMFTNMGL